jgi:adenosylcobalamin-dependent ribonucleoside-triphosphate reductase
MYTRGGAALNNCGFVSTKDIANDFSDPFIWMFKMSMLGVGVGFDTRGKGKVTIQNPPETAGKHVIEDSREGWTKALKRLLDAFAGQDTLPSEWDYSRIRSKGTPLKSFGGYASGPEPLKKMLESLYNLYASYTGREVDSELIVDTMNLIGCCVVAGGIRRSAQISFGDPEDIQFLDLKLDKRKLSMYRWVSNNSVFARKGMDYSGPLRRTRVNGEPGYLWLDNARRFGRMKDPPDNADAQAEGSNPCVEQTLWNKELCCLVETYPAHHDNIADYLRTLHISYQYAKTVTLVPTTNPATNEIMQGNRRIGCSMTGIIQAINKLGHDRFFRWCNRGYEYIQHLDKQYSDWLHIPRSIKTTSVKPSGTVSLLAGATPGVHWEHAPFYIRRLRLNESHPLAEMCKKANYKMEPDKYADNTIVISFPIYVPHLQRRKCEVTVREKLELAAKMQYHWSDNQVSCTADFDPETESDMLPTLLGKYENALKAISFLPARAHKYEQPPYEEISEATYRHMKSRLKPLTGELPHERELEASFCEGGICQAGDRSS